MKRKIRRKKTIFIFMSLLKIDLFTNFMVYINYIFKYFIRFIFPKGIAITLNISYKIVNRRRDHQLNLRTFILFRRVCNVNFNLFFQKNFSN